MRRFGEFQRMQMRRTDPRVNELFGYVRKAVDLVEQIMLLSCSPQEPDQPSQIRPKETLVPSEPPIPKKLAYHIKEVIELVGLSRSAVYAAIRAKELRAVKRGSRTLVLAEDLRAWVDRWQSFERGEERRG